MTGEIVEQTERLRPSRTFFARLQTESTDVKPLAWAACAGARRRTCAAPVRPRVAGCSSLHSIPIHESGHANTRRLVSHLPCTGTQSCLLRTGPRRTCSRCYPYPPHATRHEQGRQLEVPLSACRACSATTLALRLLVVVAEAVASDAKRPARLGLKITCKSHKAKHRVLSGKAKHKISMECTRSAGRTRPHGEACGTKKAGPARLAFPHAFFRDREFACRAPGRLARSVIKTPSVT